MSIPKKVLVTSEHKKARPYVSVCRTAYDQSQLSTEEAQILNEARGFKDELMKLIKRFSSKKHPCAELIEQYFREVLGYTLDLTGVVFPEKAGFPVYMAVPTDFDEDQIFSRIVAHFKVRQYAYQSQVASNINRNVEQKRPQGLYVFAHAGGGEPDAKHLGKSYDDAMQIGMTFMNPKEYLLATGFHRWLKGHFMDVKGWTRTSSLWSAGGLVRGDWVPSDGWLCLDVGFRGNRNMGNGPRELVLAT